MPVDKSDLLTVSQAAEQVGATSQTIRNWIRAEQLEAVRIGNRFLIPRDAVDRLRGRAADGDTGGPWDISEAPAAPLQRRSARPSRDDAGEHPLGG